MKIGPSAPFLAGVAQRKSVGFGRRAEVQVLSPTPFQARVAQLVERRHVKVLKVRGSNPFARSICLAISMDNRIVFHFNKASLGDPAIPPWTLKARGQTHYAWHVESTAPFSTKETPESTHTKGSIQFRGCLDLYDVEGKTHARITEGSK